MWKESCETFFIEFGEIVRPGLFDSDCFDDYFTPHEIHPWHEHLKPGLDPLSYKFSAKSRASDYVPANKLDLFDALICAHTAIQIYNFRNQSGPYGGFLADPFPYYIDFFDLNGNEANITDLKPAIRKWTSLVYCQKCKLPGCFSFILCPTAAVLMAEDPSDFSAYREICKSVYELDLSSYDAIEALLLYTATVK